MSIIENIGNWAGLLQVFVALIVALLSRFGLKKYINNVNRTRTSVTQKNAKGIAVQIGGDVHDTQINQSTSENGKDK